MLHRPMIQAAYHERGIIHAASMYLKEKTDCQDSWLMTELGHRQPVFFFIPKYASCRKLDHTACYHCSCQKLPPALLTLCMLKPTA